MKLYVLRATIKETYDCPDHGLTHICDRYEDVNFSLSPEPLKAMAENLNKGHVAFWSEKRSKELYDLHPSYDNNYIYTVEDVSDILI